MRQIRLTRSLPLHLSLCALGSDESRRDAGRECVAAVISAGSRRHSR